MVAASTLPLDSLGGGNLNIVGLVDLQTVQRGRDLPRVV